MDDTVPKVFCPALLWNVPPTVRFPDEEASLKLNRVATSKFVDDTFVSEDEPTVSCPVELAKMKRAEDVAPPPS